MPPPSEHDSKDISVEEGVCVSGGYRVRCATGSWNAKQLIIFRRLEVTTTQELACNLHDVDKQLAVLKANFGLVSGTR